MKVVIAIDSFKGSLSTFEAGDAARTGLLRACPDAEVTVLPIADGGEGTVDAVVAGTGGKVRELTVTGPLGTPVTARYGIVEQTSTAVIEMAAAAGITLVPPERRDPLYTTTYGVGELILDALDLGMRRFIIGIGGSATNDGGVGMLSALGFRFEDRAHAAIRRGGIGLCDLAHIDPTGADERLKTCEFRIACDVTNPLTGPRGASAVYGPQKGATPKTVERLDAALSLYAEKTREVISDADPDYPGSGAAGGMGFAFRTYLGATLTSGIALVMEATKLEAHVKTADVVIVGEGRLDGQSAMGKAPVGVARLAKAYRKPVIALSGCIARDASLCNQYGIDAFFPILPAPISLAEAMDPENAAENLANTAEQVFRLISAFKAGNK